MGLIADTPELFTMECCSCLGTYTGKPHELPGLGWVTKQYKTKGTRTPREILLCEECVARFTPKWKKAA